MHFQVVLARFYYEVVLLLRLQLLRRRQLERAVVREDRSLVFHPVSEVTRLRMNNLWRTFESFLRRLVLWNDIHLHLTQLHLTVKTVGKLRNLALIETQRLQVLGSTTLFKLASHFLVPFGLSLEDRVDVPAHLYLVFKHGFLLSFPDRR